MNLGNFRQVISSSHQPIHTFYLFTLFISKQIFSFLPLPLIMVLLSIVFGFLALLYWYRFVKIFDKKIAFYSTLLVLCFPLFFVANTNIMYESELLFFQIAALYYFFRALKKNSLASSILSGILWGISQSIFIGSLVTLPIYLLFFFLGKKKKLLFPALFITTAIITTILIDLIVLPNPQLIVNKYLTLAFIPNYDKNYSLLIFFLRIMRNFLFHPLMILSASGLSFFLIALFNLWKNDRRKFIVFTVWLTPYLILTQYWAGWLIGRIALSLIFPASLIIASASQNKFFRILIVVAILATTGNYMIKQRNKPPLYKSFSLIKEADKRQGIAVLTSDYNRFLYVENGIPIFIYRGFGDTNDEKEFILKNLKEGKKVLFDSSGLRFPYYQFDSDFFQILSMGKIGVSQGSKILSEFDFKVYAQDPSNKDIYFLEIIKFAENKKPVGAKIFYPNSLYYISQNRPYRYDPFANLFYLILRKKDPQYWWYE